MKLLFCLLRFLPIIFLFSCTKNNSTEEDDRISQKIETILGTRDIRFQQIAFSKFDNDEKSLIWQKHLVNVKEIYKLESEKNAFIEKVIFLLRSNPSIVSNIDELVKLEYEAKKIFTLKELAQNFGRLSVSKNIGVNSVGGVESDETMGFCDCNLNSAYTCIIDEPGPFCRASTCKEVPNSCGFLFGFTCNGNCRAS